MLGGGMNVNLMPNSMTANGSMPTSVMSTPVIMPVRGPQHQHQQGSKGGYDHYLQNQKQNRYKKILKNQLH